MKILKPQDLPLELPNPVVTLGNFDGVHLGHRRLLEETRRLAEELKGTSVVATFEPHPRRVLRPEADLKLLTTFEERLALFKEAGMEAILVIPFTSSLAALPAEEFVEEYLVYGLRARGVVVGYDYRFGKKRKGDTELLKRLGEKYNFSVIVVPPQRVNGTVISSSLIRELLEKGRVEEAARLLGRPYSVKGKVIKGHGRGVQLGFPTANLEVPREKLIPALGVYAVRVVVFDGGRLSGVANIGYKPTFSDKELSFEVHIFNFNGNLYGKTITVEFIKYIRPELKFPSSSALKEQIHKDCLKAKEILKEILN